ncbi:UNVERIFIED_CONTAM: hypothetical protein RMT77_013056 [Armadillidium vulgare]
MTSRNPNLTKQNFFILCCFVVAAFVLLLRIFYKDYKIKIPPIQNNPNEELLSPPHEESFDREKSIFFIEGFGKNYIPARMLCSIESAALVHNNTFIDVLMTSRTLQKSVEIRSLLKAYSNVRFLYLNATTLYMESPMREWFLKETWKSSKYPEINFVDPLRYLLLYKYGGIYLDMDIIVLKNLKMLENFAGLESDSWVNCAVMGFRKGHPFLNDCITEMTQHFDSELWGINGPKLITKIFRRRCHAELPDTTLKNCSDIKLFKREVFYPISWTKLDKFFEEDQEFTNTLLNDPDILTLHFWNHHTESRIIPVDGQNLYSVIVRHLCPITALSSNYIF